MTATKGARSYFTDLCILTLHNHSDQRCVRRSLRSNGMDKMVACSYSIAFDEKSSLRTMRRQYVKHMAVLPLHAAKMVRFMRFSFLTSISNFPIRDISSGISLHKTQKVVTGRQAGSLRWVRRRRCLQGHASYYMAEFFLRASAKAVEYREISTPSI